jgi:hypothetical protein
MCNGELGLDKIAGIYLTKKGLFAVFREKFKLFKAPLIFTALRYALRVETKKKD